MKKNKIQLCLIFTTITSIFLMILNYQKLSLIISCLNLLFCLPLATQNKRRTLFIITISLATIITNILIIKNTKESIDIYKNINVLIGTWEYNEFGGTYTFNDDNSYINYIFNDTKDNYCKGTYEYTFGGKGKNNTIIKEDENFYHYNLTLNEEYCTINNQKTTSNNNNFIFSISKKDDTKLLINKETEELYILKKKS